MENLTPWLWPALIAACAVVAFTPLVRRLAATTNVVAHPKSDRWHRRIVPMLGGIAIFGGVAVSLIVGGWPDRTMLPLLVVGAGMFVVGLTDDFVHLKPGTKLNAQIVVACSALIVGEPAAWTGRAAIDALLTIFWIVGITNALNLLDNMDGLCAGVAGIAAMACWAALAPAAVLPAHYAAAITGACIGFLLFNFNPASVFMGDSGSLFLGGSLAMLALAGGSSAEGHLLSAIAVPVLLLLIPIFDMVFVTLSRILSRRAASTGGRDHTSHRLVAMGFSEREAVVILWGLAAVAGLAAVLGRYAIETAFIAPLLVIVVILLGIQLARVRVYDGQDFSVLTKGRYTPLLVSFTYKRRVFEVLLDVLLVALCYYGAYLIRFDENVSLYAGLIIQSLPIVIACQVVSFGVVGVYRGTWRYIGVTDVTTFAKGIALGTVSAVIALVYLYRFEGYSRSVFLIYAMTLALCVLSARLSTRLLAEVAGRHRTTGRRALIYGAGDGGAVLLRELRSNPQYGYHAVGFIDDDASKSRKRILGVPVIGGVGDLESSVASLRPEVVIVSTPKLASGRLEQVRQVCYASGTELLQFRFTLNGVDVTPGNVARRD